MTKRMVAWFRDKWQQWDYSVYYAYQGAFLGSPEGQRVLQHLMDNIYCRVYEGKDPIEAVIHNARRSVVQEILEILDRVEKPMKYTAPHVEMGNGLVR